MTGVVAACALAVVLVAGTGLTRNLPQAALAAVVMAAVIGLVDLPSLRWLARVNHVDFALAIAALLGVVAFGVLIGIGIAIGLSTLAFLWRAWHPYDAVLGRVTGRKGYHDVGATSERGARAGARPVPLRRATFLRKRRRLP